MSRHPRHEPKSRFSRLLHEARNGSLDALGQLFEEARPRLLTLAARALYQNQQAKISPADCVQDAFLEAQRDFERFHGYSPAEFLSWLRRILMHNLADHRRRFATQIRDIRLERPLSEVNAVTPLTALDSNPEERVAAEEQVNRLRTAMSALPRPYRRVLQLRHDEGLTFAQIAKRMQKPSEEAARKLWQRAVKSLRSAISLEIAGTP
ncbi:MAG: sigma-70 family RNA polymerase sigma factor [Gemmataceae bacterium]|nr:sigma-70 family RNA polymerase sigma factor [Gemmataceae bacterium]